MPKALWFILGHGPNSLGDLLFGAFVVLVVLEGTGLLIHVARKTYLVLTRQGVEYHGAWCSLYTPWDNVVCGSAYGLLLRCEPAFRGREWCRPVAAQQPSGTGYATPSGFGASGSRVVVASQLGMVFARTCVPLNEFASKWRQSALGRDIAYYAPQVFGQVPASLLEPADPDQIVAPPPWWPTATRLISMRTYLWGYAAIHAALLLVLVLIWHVATA